MSFVSKASGCFSIAIMGALVCLGVFKAEAFSDDRTPPGWTGSDLLLDGVPLSGIMQTMADGSRIFVTHHQNQVALVNPATGTMESLGQPTDPLISAEQMTLSGGFLLFASKEYQLVEGSYLVAARLDVLDLGTRIWRETRKTVLSQQIQLSEYMRPAVHHGEFRIVLGTGEILRWKTSDMTPLETLVPGFSSPNLQGIVATSTGDEFCVGVTDTDRKLVVEKDGVFRKLSFPKYLSLTGRILSSGEFLVAPVSGSGGSHGVMIWDKSKIDQGGRFQERPDGYSDPEYSLWNERFLIAVQGDIEQEKYKLLAVYDLTKPTAAPVSIPLPAGFAPGMGSGISGNFMWSVDHSATPAKLLRFPIFPTSKLVSVDVAPARAVESEGQLRFLVTADRPLTAPVVVNLRTVPASAKEGADYVKYEGAVTLTPAKPTAEVVVTVLQDLEVESYESMILEVTGVTGAWNSHPFTTGVIQGSGFVKLPDITGVPTAFGFGQFAKEWILTELGVVALTDVSSTEAAFHFYRYSTGKWERLTALGTISAFDSWYTKRIIDTSGNLLLVGKDRVDPQNPLNAYTLIALNLESGEIQGTADTVSLQGMVHTGGIVALGKDYPTKFFNHPFVSGTAWDLPLVPGKFARLSNSTFVIEEPSGSFFVRNLSDGAVKETFPSFIPRSAAGNFMLSFGSPLSGNEYLRLINTSGNGYPVSQFFAESGSDPDSVGHVLENGFAVIWQPYTTPSSRSVVDGTTGAALATLPGYSKISVVGDVVAAEESGRRLSLFSTSPALPQAIDKSFTRSEGEDPSTWRLRLSEAAAIPLTARVIASGADIIAGPSVTIPPGSTNVPFPALIAADSFPEDSMKVDFTIEISGGGHTASYPCSVKIPANDYIFLDPISEDDLTEGSAVALHPSGIAIGSVTKLGAADIRYKKVYRPKKLPVVFGDQVPNFGHVVAINARYLVVGAPGYEMVRGAALLGSVYVYDRKSGKLLQNPSGAAGNMSYGSVVRLDDERLFVASPGPGARTEVKVITIGKSQDVELKPPGAIGKNDGFGTSIASKGNDVWVGAPGRNRVYQFKADSGKLVRTIAPPASVGSSATNYQNFGQSMEIIGSALFVGAPTATDSSSVIRVDPGSGKSTGVIRCPLSDGGYFGASLAVLKDGVLAVGCPASAFSPAGGFMLYRKTDGDPQFITMVRPPRPTGGQEQNQQLLGLGIAGGLSGTGTTLGVVAGKLENPLDVIKSRYTIKGYSQFRIAVLDLSPYLRNAAKPTVLQFASAASSASPQTVWEKALGPDGKAEDLSINVVQGNQGDKVMLPDILTLATGTKLVVEQSTDLANWASLAILTADTPEWSVSGGVSFTKPNLLEIPKTEEGKQVFYRIRCEVP